MKHLLNNLSEEEKNSIREQHEGGMKINTDRFKKLMESKSGNVKPLISEQMEESSNEELINQIIKMDAEFNNDPVYVEYEKKYAINKLKNMLSASMGIDLSEVPDEMAEMMMDLAGEMSKQPITPEIVVKNKNSVINTVKAIIELCEKDQETEVCGRLKEFLSLLEKL